MALFLLMVVVIFVGANALHLFKLYKNLNSFIMSIQSNNLVSYSLELQPGSSAPIFNEKDQFGNMVSNKNEDGINFIFISPTCPTCKSLINDLHKLKVELKNNLVFVSQGKIDDKYIDDLTYKKIPYIDSIRLVDDFNIRGVPKLVSINSANKITKVETISSVYDLQSNIEVA